MTSPEKRKLLLATNNKGKLKEYLRLLEGLPFELTTLAEHGITAEVDETGSTFEENAVRKATQYAAMSGLITVADDSGLEVDALGGEPGVMSRRYAGENASDRERIDYLLQKLKDVPPGRRTARFRCVIAIAAPSGEVETCEGACEGTILFEPRGSGGFGYDPVFHLAKLGKSMAELSEEQKNRVSHRGRAARKARQFLESIPG